MPKLLHCMTHPAGKTPCLKDVLWDAYTKRTIQANGAGNRALRHDSRNQRGGNYRGTYWTKALVSKGKKTPQASNPRETESDDQDCQRAV